MDKQISEPVQLYLPSVDVEITIDSRVLELIQIVCAFGIYVRNAWGPNAEDQTVIIEFSGNEDLAQFYDMVFMDTKQSDNNFIYERTLDNNNLPNEWSYSLVVNSDVYQPAKNNPDNKIGRAGFPIRVTFPVADYAIVLERIKNFRDRDIDYDDAVNQSIYAEEKYRKREAKRKEKAQKMKFPNKK